MQRDDAAQPLRLMVMESGACSGAGCTKDWANGSDLVVVAQSADDRPAALALRAARRIAALERAGRVANEAVLVLGSRDGGQVRAARGVILRALLTHVQAGTGGDVVLLADANMPHARRHELFGLVGDLAADLRDSHVSVAVRFASPAEPSSGVHAVAAPVERMAV